MSNLLFTSCHSWYKNFLVRGLVVYETTSYISVVFMILNTLHSFKRFYHKLKSGCSYWMSFSNSKVDEILIIIFGLHS